MDESIFIDDVSSNDLFSLQNDYLFETNSGIKIIALSPLSESGELISETQDNYYQEIILGINDIRSMLSVLLFVQICAFLIPWIKGVFKGFFRGGKD